jgi:hypothetical protein
MLSFPVCWLTINVIESSSIWEGRGSEMLGVGGRCGHTLQYTPKIDLGRAKKTICSKPQRSQDGVSYVAI